MNAVAVKRKYQSLRRTWLAEQKDNFQEQAEIEGYTKKKRARRQRV